MVSSSHFGEIYRPSGVVAYLLRISLADNVLEFVINFESESPPGLIDGNSTSFFSSSFITSESVVGKQPDKNRVMIIITNIKPVIIKRLVSSIEFEFSSV